MCWGSLGPLVSSLGLLAMGETLHCIIVRYGAHSLALVTLAPLSSSPHGTPELVGYRHERPEYLSGLLPMHKMYTVLDQCVE